jgi:hypothetical protein
VSVEVVPATHVRAFALAGVAHCADAALAATPPAAGAGARLARSLGWAADLAALGADLLPLPMVHDLGWLLVESSGFGFSALSDAPAGWSAAERALRVAYQNHALAPLARAPWFAAVHRAASGAAADEVVVRFLEIAGARIAAAAPAAAPLAPAARATPRDLRALAQSLAAPPWDLAGATAEIAALFPPPPGEEPLAEWLRAATDALARADPRNLLDAADQFELAHLPAFATPAQRLGARRLAALEAAIPPFAPRRLPRTPEAGAAADTALPDEGTFPQGGLAELTTRGTLENLVRTELVYAGEQAIPGVDWLTLRYVENELLYYRREEGQLRRARRTLWLALVLGPDLDARLAGDAHPPGAYLEALLVAAGRSARALFARDSLELRVAVWGAPGPGGDAERTGRAQRLALALRDGARTTPAIDSRAAPPPPAALHTAGRRVHVVRFGCGDTARADVDERRAHRDAAVALTVVSLDSDPAHADAVLDSRRPLAPQLGAARDAIVERLLAPRDDRQ